MFDTAMKILQSGNFTEESTIQMIVTSVIGFAMDEAERKLLLTWFQQDAVITKDGNKVKGVSLTKKHKHAIVKKVFSAKTIPLEEKTAALDALSKIDQSDMLGRTKFFCQAAVPEIAKKREAWEAIFSGKLDKESLLNTNEFCAGFKQFSQRDILTEFADDFFNKIEHVVQTKAKSISESIYFYLQPNMITNDKEIERF